MKRKPSFIGVGAPKCGTTWVYECLEEHPGICMGKPKEIHFFNRYHGTDSENKGFQLEKGMGAYASHFAECPANAVIGEFSPKYLFDPDVPELIKRHVGPDVKILIVLRNPIERAFSHYKHFKSKFPEKYTDFETAMEINPDILEWSRYEKYLPAFLNAFPRDQVLVKIFDDLESAPEAFMRDIYRFVGVDETFIPPSVGRKVNASEQRFSEKRKKKMSVIFRVYGKLNNISLLRPLLRLAKGAGVSAAVKKQVDKSVSGEGVKEVNKEFTPETQKMLREIFDETVRETESLLGKKLPGWR